MYVNIEQLALSGLAPSDLINLLAIRQKDEFFIKGIPEEDINIYLTIGYIEKLKNGNYRLTKKGNGFIIAVETPGLTDEISETQKILVNIYENRGKEIGVSVKEVESRLVWFMGNTNFKKDVVIDGVERYLDSCGEYTMSLCNLIWKPPSVAFSVHKNLKDSRLFDIIVKKYRFDPEEYFNEEKNKEVKWLFAVSKLPDPPLKASSDILFTLDAKKDRERIRNIKTYLYNYLRKFK